MKRLVLIVSILMVQYPVWAQNGNFAQVNGVKIYYETHGGGEPLVLLHYFTGSHIVWDPFIADLSENYRLIIPDLRGHGRSTNPSGKFRHKASAKDIYALMDELDIEKFKGIGASAGAITLLHMATMDSTRIEAMVLVGGTSYNPEEARKIQRNYSISNKVEKNDNWMATMQERHPGGEEQIKSLIHQFNNFADTYEDMNFTPPYLAQVKCPTLIVHGDRDRHFPVNIPVEMYSAIPESYLWVIPNGSHLPIFGDSLWSDPFLKVSKQFLEGKFSND